MYVNFVSMIFNVAMATANFTKVWPKIKFFNTILYFFQLLSVLDQIAEIHKLFTFYKHSCLILY